MKVRLMDRSGFHLWLFLDLIDFCGAHAYPTRPFPIPGVGWGVPQGVWINRPHRVGGVITANGSNNCVVIHTRRTEQPCAHQTGDVDFITLGQRLAEAPALVCRPTLRPGCPSGNKTIVDLLVCGWPWETCRGAGRLSAPTPAARGNSTHPTNNRGLLISRRYVH